MYCKCTLRLIHSTYLNLNEFRAVVSQVQRWRRLVQDIKPQGERAFLCCVNYNDTGIKQELIPFCCFLRKLQGWGWGCTHKGVFMPEHSHGEVPKARWLRLAPCFQKALCLLQTARQLLKLYAWFKVDFIYCPCYGPNHNVWNQNLHCRITNLIQPSGFALFGFILD